MTKQYNDTFYHVDYNAIIGGIKGDGVVSGLDVSERGAGQNMSVDVASGSAIIDETKYTESSTVNLSISAAHGTLPRRDIIIYDTATTNPIVVTGTPATEPIPPNITTGDILLSVVNIAAGVTLITNTDIDDCRIWHRNHHSIHESGGEDIVNWCYSTISNVLSSRSDNVQYQNTHDVPLHVYFRSHVSGVGECFVGSASANTSVGNAVANGSVYFVVPSGWYYKINWSGTPQYFTEAY